MIFLSTIWILKVLHKKKQMDSLENLINPHENY